ncbi:MAG TPA: phage capsid protein [Pyrinomonadaceae bacterium]|nr:phage capsid protein [Pyrinomonadaceae bacterium]
MSINLPTHYVQQYSTNIALLLQQKGSKLRNAVTVGSYTGKAASPVDQIGKVEMQSVTSRFAAMGRVDAPTDRRWVYPSDFDLPQLIDSFDKLRLITDPSSSYVQNAVMAAGRQFDRLICTAFTGTAKTGETGSTSTSFTAGNEVDVAVGGANSKLNVAKLREVKRLMMANHVDFDMEEAFVGITAADHDALLGEIQVVSRDFNGGQAVLRDGKIMEFMGFKFIHCELIETALAGTNEVTLPVWVKSGMHLGMWNDIDNSVSIRHDLQGEPWQLYTKMTAGATRLEENKVYAIESYRA